VSSCCYSVLSDHSYCQLLLLLSPVWPLVLSAPVGTQSCLTNRTVSSCCYSVLSDQSYCQLLLLLSPVWPLVLSAPVVTQSCLTTRTVSSCCYSVLSDTWTHDPWIQEEHQITFGEFGPVRHYKTVGTDRNEITNQNGSYYMSQIFLRACSGNILITKHIQLRNLFISKLFFCQYVINSPSLFPVSCGYPTQNTALVHTAE
jgi:hypothetical protein